MTVDLEPYERDLLLRLARNELEDIEVCIVNGGDDSAGNLRLSTFTLQAVIKKLEEAHAVPGV